MNEFKKALIQTGAYFGSIVGVYLNHIPLTVLMCTFILCAELRYRQ